MFTEMSFSYVQMQLQKRVIVSSPTVLPFGSDSFATLDIFALESWKMSMINNVYIDM